MLLILLLFLPNQISTNQRGNWLDRLLGNNEKFWWQKKKKKVKNQRKRSILPDSKRIVEPLCRPKFSEYLNIFSVE